MSLSKANIAGLASPQQQSEMKCLLAGTWPPLKPLPVFKYEASDYRATIDFDKLRGEWVCRKTSFPSNQVQELRGELREITLALPHAGAELLVGDAADQEHELEKDTARRQQAIRDWKENFENGARYFALRGCLSENQRNELDESLRLSLTARQLQFSAKNVSSVFEALSTAGGRFATLMEFARRNKACRETLPQPLPEETLPEAEPASDLDKSQPLNADLAPVPDPETREPRIDLEEPPSLSIQNLLQEPYQSSLADHVLDLEPRHPREEAPEIADADSSSFFEESQPQEHHALDFSGPATLSPSSPSSADRATSSSARPLALEISVFQVAVFAALAFCVAIAFAVGLTMGRGPLGTRLRQLPNSILTRDAKSPTAAANPAAEPASPVLAPSPARSGNIADNKQPDAPTPLEETPPTASKPPVQPEPNSDFSRTSAPMERALPPAPPKSLHLPRSAGSFLVSVPAHTSQPFRVTLPEKPVAATSSFAMTSQLSVLVPSDLEPATAHKSARLEPGQLVSFAWPHYPKPRYGSAEIIRVRATIGPLGQVQDVKFLSGESSLLSSTARAIRQWRYTPTLLEKRPVQAQQDLTIAFRPSSHSSQTASRHPSQKIGR